VRWIDGDDVDGEIIACCWPLRCLACRPIGARGGGGGKPSLTRCVPQYSILQFTVPRQHHPPSMLSAIVMCIEKNPCLSRLTHVVVRID
jgi:hypothetical protein